MYTYSFEKLDVWQKSRTLSVSIYNVTKSFPPSELFGVTNQLRRCAISICSNIAEGTGRITPKDKAHFSTIAYGSLMELLNQLIISNDLEFLKLEDLNLLRTSIEEIGFRLTKLRDAQLAPKTVKN